jgi:hypothetical protein
VSDMQVLDQDSSDEEFAALLVGRRIVAAEFGSFARPGGSGSGFDDAPGRLTLDDGTMVLVTPNDGGCSCTAGDYELTSLAAVDNIITSARSVAQPHPEYPDDEDAISYRIYVYADNVEVNAVQVDGNDGNGYYGTGYKLMVLRP